MEKQELDNKIKSTAKALLSYCRARTSNLMDAEDLAQDIVVEVYRSAKNLRNDEAFYGFLWAVAGNVYKQWYRTQARRQETDLPETLVEEPDFFEEEQGYVYLLRRELTLLRENYRKAVLLYYLNHCSCAEIAEQLSVSESMVKYLLFKSRQILKEGIGMERTYGQQSYNPKALKLLFWGNHGEQYYHLADGKIAQNILFACYHDKLTAEQISLEIGVALPYMEEELMRLNEYKLLRKDGQRYSTNIAIFTRDFYTEVAEKTAAQREKIAELLLKATETHRAELSNLGFDDKLGENCRLWQSVCFLLYDAIIEKLQERLPRISPKEQFGTDCVIWGVETGMMSRANEAFCFGISNDVNGAGDWIQFMDFPIHGEMAHEYFYLRQDAVNLFLELARGKVWQFSENDRLILAELIRRGYVIDKEKGYAVNVPVITWEQFQKMKAIFAETACEIADTAEQMLKTVTELLKNHIPIHLKKTAGALAYFRLFEDAISAPVEILYNRRLLMPYHGEGMLPTTYVVLR